MGIYMFSKTFKEKSHCEEFLKGQLRVSQLKTFIKMESDVRGDRHEGIAAIYNPSKIRLTIEGIEIPSDDIVGNIVIQNDIKGHTLCVSASYFPDDKKQENFKSKQELLANFKYVNSDVAGKFGQYTVFITSPKIFMERIQKKCDELNKKLSRGLVKYVDNEQHHGNIEKVGFTKIKKYEEEVEYRFLIEELSEKEIEYLEIGDMNDIAKMYKTSEIDKLIQIRYNE